MSKGSYLILILALVFFITGCTSTRPDVPTNSIPNLPVPIARERALVTTAGQGTEGLILAKYATQLNIRNYYRHRAEPLDLQDVNSVIIALGYSPTGLERAYMDSAQEQQRLTNLVNASHKASKPVIMIHIGGMQRRSALNDTTATTLASKVDYLIVLADSNQDDFFTRLADDFQLPFTQVSNLEGIKVPLNSAYR